MLDGEITDRVEADSLQLKLEHIDFYSSSWGPDDNGKTVDGPGKLARMSLEKGIRTGRQGRGAVYVWASGNGGSAGDSCACDGYANNIYTISVSSLSQVAHPHHISFSLSFFTFVTKFCLMRLSLSFLNLHLRVSTLR